jgi:hypothetical protein
VLAKFPVAELLHPRHLTACRVHNVMVRPAPRAQRARARVGARVVTRRLPRQVKCAQQLAPPNKPPKAADIITVLRASLEASAPPPSPRACAHGGRSPRVRPLTARAPVGARDAAPRLAGPAGQGPL